MMDLALYFSVIYNKNGSMCDLDITIVYLSTASNAINENWNENMLKNSYLIISKLCVTVGETFNTNIQLWYETDRLFKEDVVTLTSLNV